MTSAARRRSSRFAGALASVAALAVVVAPGAAAAGEGAIAGQIVDVRTGAPVAGACATAAVQGMVWGYDALVDVATARTGADGRFRIPDLPPAADYRVVFSDCSDRFYRYGTQTWNGLTSRRYDGDPVAVTSGGTTTVDARLAQAGVLQTMVRDAAGNPLQDAYVEVEPVGHDLPREQPTVRTTNADGQTQPMALMPGLYRLSVADQRTGLLKEWFEDRFWREDADLIRITSAQDVRPQIRLAPGSVVEGTVTDATTGEPVPDNVVFLRRADDPERDAFQAQVSGGTFRFGPLPAGSYKLRTAGSSLIGSDATGTVVGGPGHLPTWFGGNWPDALTAGPAAAHAGAPFLLVDPRMPTTSTLSWLDGVGRLDGATLVGDQGALSPAVEAAVRRRLDVDPPWPGVTR